MVKNTMPTTAPPRLLMASQLVVWNGDLYETDIPCDLDVQYVDVSTCKDDNSRIAVHVHRKVGHATLYCLLIPLPRPVVRLQQRWRRRLAMAH